MATVDYNSQLDTHFAPAERASAEELGLLECALASNEFITSLLNAIPDPVMILNRQRQIVAVNSKLLDLLGAERADGMIGLRPGELVNCVHATEMPGGCGTSPACTVCGAVRAIMDSIRTSATCAGECRIRTFGKAHGGALDLEVQASFLELGDSGVVIFTLKNVAAEKRRYVLERAFFHDVLNLATGLEAVANLLEDAEEDHALQEQYKHDLSLMTMQLTDEITAHRQLLSAESGDLELNVEAVIVPEMLDTIADMYRHHSIARHRKIDVLSAPPVELETDPVLLRRVLGNLLKNALEATPEGGTVTIAAERHNGVVSFAVHNPSVMPDDVQLQVFQRSFSTKAESGRGIGTHSVKLLTEGYLGGDVTFSSQEPEGTVFTVTIPIRPETNTF